jgi:hypothetical protein
VLLTLAGATAAAAEDDEEVSPFEARSTAVFLHVGVSAPLGFGGFEAEQAIVPAWTVSAGVGLGAAGGQVGAMTHLRLGGSWSRFEVGAGLSHGKHVWTEFCGDETCAQKSGTVTRANLELGGTHRWPHGFSMRYFVGYGHVVAGDLVCEGDTVDNCRANHQNDGQSMTYTGFAVGGSF